VIREFPLRFSARPRPSALASVGVSLALLAAAPSAEAAASADLATTVTAPATIYFTGNITYRITVTNDGPSDANTVVMSDNWWSGWTSFLGVSGSAPAGVSCTAPAVGSVGTVTCTTPSLAPGASMAIALTIHVRAVFHNQLVVDSATASSQTPDPNLANNTVTVATRGL
jgi:uncharacterized repeat protein (TIGR01451 family)